MTEHELKTWPEFFESVSSGRKPFEVRKNDRDFKVGDVLILKEWDPEKELYSGRVLYKTVTYLLPGGSFGIDPDYCVMGLGVLPDWFII